VRNLKSCLFFVVFDMDGILLIDKPSGPTSHDVVNSIRRRLRQRRIGHAGTLDPLASGLLVCLVGRATRLAQFITGHHKTYHVTAVLNEMRDTYDRVGTIITQADRCVTPDQMRAAVEQFPREYDQMPPSFSAKQIAGRRAYDLAREGKPVELKPQRVRIYELSLVRFEFPRVDLSTDVSAGTYVRSLVVDLAETLGTFAYVDELRRIASGPFRVENAVPLDEFTSLSDAEVITPLLPVDAGLADLPSIHLAPDENRRFVDGQELACPAVEGLVAVYCDQRFVGVGQARDGQLKPIRVIYR